MLGTLGSQLFGGIILLIFSEKILRREKEKRGTERKEPREDWGREKPIMLTEEFKASQ